MSDDHLLERMRANPRGDWTISDIERICRRSGLTVTAPRRGSHYKVRHPPSGIILTIPARRPIKPVYIRVFIALLDRIRGGNQEP